jgi:hypothetical protein
MAETPSSFPTRPSSYDKKIGLVLQGGGALGSYLRRAIDRGEPMLVLQ